VCLFGCIYDFQYPAEHFAYVVCLKSKCTDFPMDELVM
jgi:hypothetical protein